MAQKQKDNYFAEALSGTEPNAFNYFEPFDAPPRPAWLMGKAKSAEIELDPNGNGFQTAMLLDTTKTPGSTLTTAGSQSGKSRGHLIEAVIMASGQVPISLRYEKGVDTNVKRLVVPENISRFGRFDSSTKKLIDHNVKAPQSEGWKEWDCGNIIGAGVYPQEKIPSAISQVWICTYKEVKSKMWVPRLREIIPPHFLDNKRGVNGFSEQKGTYFLENGNTISFITYEQDYTRVEGEKERVNLIILDEEPPKRDFYISALEHCQFLRTCFSPINGLSWAYYDLYLPIISGQNKHCKIYYCSQYDTPYQKKDDVDQKINIYKPYEVKARVWGYFSDMAGRPYYTFEITNRFLRRYVPRHTNACIMPVKKPDTVRDALKTKMQFLPMTEGGDDVWEIYEQFNENHTYWLSADIAEGNDNPDAATDASVAYIRRLPRADEKEPVMVAGLHSRMRNVEFSWMCLYAACYYNFCLLAPESRGEDAAVFLTTVLGYPFMYQHVSRSDKTRRLTEHPGFDTTAGNRKVIFDLVGSWIYDHADDPKIYHYALLKEIAECIVGKGGRPDHSEKGSTDCLIAFGISEWVWRMCSNQIKNNKNRRFSVAVDDGPSFFPNVRGLHKPVKETRKVLGSEHGLDYRERFLKK